MKTKLQALRARLLAAQRRLIQVAAESGTVPADNTMRKIADMEVTLGAIEAMIDEERSS